MSLVIAVAMAIPPVLLREFGRRYSFAHLLTSQALIVDAAVTVSLIAILVGLAWAGHLKAFTAVLTLGFACGSCALTWLLFKRRAFDFDRKNAALTIRSSFELGKWLLLSQLALQMQGYATHWITMLAAGAVATGLYSACLSIVALANPFLFGYFNILTPRFVRVFKQPARLPCGGGQLQMPCCSALGWASLPWPSGCSAAQSWACCFPESTIAAAPAF